MGSLALGLACVVAGCSGDFGTSNSDDAGGGGGADDGGGAGGADGGTGGGGDPEGNTLLNGITAAHNVARAGVMPAPTTPMPPLTWDTTVAATAQAWANTCQWKHSGGSYGENIFADTGQSNSQAVVADWVSEKKNYTYSTNTCTGVCGHYTQVVWAKSLRLGCGVKQCTTGSPFGSFNGGKWNFWVCNYDPAGNFSGQKPY